MKNTYTVYTVYYTHSRLKESGNSKHVIISRSMNWELRVELLMIALFLWWHNFLHLFPSILNYVTHNFLCHGNNNKFKTRFGTLVKITYAPFRSYFHTDGWVVTSNIWYCQLLSRQIQMLRKYGNTPPKCLMKWKCVLWDGRYGWQILIERCNYESVLHWKRMSFDEVFFVAFVSCGIFILETKGKLNQFYKGTTYQWELLSLLFPFFSGIL